MSIRFKVILPYLLLTIFVAVTGAYVVIRLVSKSLDERLSNQLLESGRVVSDLMARQETRHVEAARLFAFTLGLGEAVQAGAEQQINILAEPAAGGLNVEDVLIFDQQGREKFHSIRQPDGSSLIHTKLNQPVGLPVVKVILAEKNPDSLPRRMLSIDPVDGRYYYFTTLPIAFEGEVVGAVAVGTSVNTIMPMLKNTSLADVIFYNSAGQAFATTVGSVDDALFVRTISIPRDTYQRVIDQDDTVEGENLQVAQRWYRVARGPLKIGNDRLAVFAVILPLDFVVEAGSTNRTNYVLLYSAAMAAVVAVGYVIARLIVNPILALVRASRAIADGDLTQRATVMSKDEIGALAHTFNNMTEKLQRHTIELERANRILEQMNNTKIRFIQVSAHELRTPMTLVQGYAQMAQIKSNGNADLDKYTKGILEGTTRMVEIIDNMLDVSRIDSNLLDVTLSRFRITQPLERVNKMFSAAFEERNLRFTVENVADLPEIQADKELIYKVFYHVIGNAIKYTPDGGFITVTGQTVNSNTQNPEIEIAVKDTGIGLDPQFQELIFEKFYQTGEVLLHSSGKTKFKGGGPGLGLAISRGIINAHHGHIRLESPGHNEQTYPGATVYIRLPVNGHFDGNNNA